MVQLYNKRFYFNENYTLAAISIREGTDEVIDYPVCVSSHLGPTSLIREMKLARRPSFFVCSSHYLVLLCFCKKKTQGVSEWYNNNASGKITITANIIMK